jgi:hypothetical protein
MSDTTTMPFQPGLVTEAPPAPEVDDSPGNRRMLLVLGGLAGLAVLAIAAYFLLFSGGSSNVATNAVTVAPKSSAQPSTGPSTAPKTAAVPKISKRNFGTDPFKALLTDSTATGTTASGTTASGTAPTSTTPTTTTPVTTTPVTTTPVTTTPVTTQSHHFRVVSVPAGNKTINVKVDGKSYNGLKAGQVFGKIFKVRLISGTSNSFQIGGRQVFNVIGVKAVTIST